MKQILTGRQRQAIISSALVADNQIVEYKVYLKELSKLKVIHKKLGVGIADIETKEKDINYRIDKLKKHISTRFSLILNASEKRLFCEAYDIGNGKYEIKPSSVTKSPITQLGSYDLNRGYIILTQVKLLRKPNIIKLIPIRLDLRTTTITVDYSEEI